MYDDDACYQTDLDIPSGKYGKLIAIPGGPGVAGPAGPAGETGPAGPAGADSTVPGPAGPQGVAGAVGQPGVSLDIEATVATYADLPAAPVAGSAYVVAADGLLYFFDGTAFPADGSGVPFVGPQGQQGLQGVAGPAGADGVAGADGATGADGVAGAPGPVGPAGPTEVSADAGNASRLGSDGKVFTASGGGLVSAPAKTSFPAVGDPTKVYLATDSGDTFRFDPVAKAGTDTYVRISESTVSTSIEDSTQVGRDLITSETRMDARNVIEAVGARSVVYHSPKGKPDGPIAAGDPLDSGVVFSNTGARKYKYVDGRFAHDPAAVSGTPTAGYLQVELDDVVRAMRAEVAWPANALGAVAFVIPSTLGTWDFDKGTLPAAGVHLTAYGNGTWNIGVWNPAAGNIGHVDHSVQPGTAASFTLTVQTTTPAATQTTASILASASEADVKSALEALSNVGAGKSTVTKSVSGNFGITWATTLGTVTLTATGIGMGMSAPLLLNPSNTIAAVVSYRTGVTFYGDNTTVLRYKTVWDNKLRNFEVYAYPETDQVLIAFPDGSSSGMLTHPGIGLWLSNRAVWELFDNNTSAPDIPATMGKISADIQKIYSDCPVVSRAEFMNKATAGEQNFIAATRTGSPVTKTITEAPLNVEPIGSSAFVSNLHNGLVYWQERGGTIVVTKNGADVSAASTWQYVGGAGNSPAGTGNIARCYMSPDAVTDVFVITVNIPAGIWTPAPPWIAGLQFPFGMGAKNVKIESSVDGTTWTSHYSTASDVNSLHWVKVAAGTPKNLRYTLTDLSKTGLNNLQVSSLFLVDSTDVGRFTGLYLPRSGGTMFGTVNRPPTLTVKGVDPNIDLRLVSQGTGQVKANGVPVTTGATATGGLPLSLWSGTKAQYDAIATKSATTIYVVTSAAATLEGVVEGVTSGDISSAEPPTVPDSVTDAVGSVQDTLGSVQTGDITAEVKPTTTKSARAKKAT